MSPWRQQSAYRPTYGPEIGKVVKLALLAVPLISIKWPQPSKWSILDDLLRVLPPSFYENYNGSKRRNV
jgi:hypothetical protein